jgi:hypothetical protein
LDEKSSDRPGRPKSAAGAPKMVLALSMLVLVCAVIWIMWQGRDVVRSASGRVNHVAASPRTPWKNAEPNVKYVGDAACARCHAEIADTYRRHPMGQSLKEIAPDGARSDVVATFKAGTSRYSVEHRGGRLIHRETRIDDGGDLLAQVEAEVKYAVGSGERGISYLIERDGRLFQSPITWYSQKNRWDLSPGYELGNLHFDRPIEPGCLFCHSNRAIPIAHTLNQYERPIFRGHAIGCERCHGPGELHLRSQQVVDGRDLSIVNPRHLEPALRSAVCEQCHLQGDHQIDRIDRDMFDYRPGHSLIDFIAVYGRADHQDTRFVGQVEQMKDSRCYRASQSRLGCTSCHDPHQTLVPAEKTLHYRQQCLVCHETKGCSLADRVRLAESPQDSCIQCHMQRFKRTDIIHTATTDHRILRTPLPEESDQKRVVAGLPLVLLNRDGVPADELKALDRELAIALATEGPRLHDSPQVREMGRLVLALLDRAITTRPDDLAARLAKARVLALSGRRSQAIPVVQSALAMSRTDERALDQYLSYAVDENDIQAALEPARRAVAVNPWSSIFHERLAFFLLESQDYAGSLRESSEALRLNPFLRFARMFLVESLLKRGEADRADAEFARLIKIHESHRQALEIWYAEKRRH